MTQPGVPETPAPSPGPIPSSSPVAWLNGLVHPTPPPPLRADDPVMLPNGMRVPHPGAPPLPAPGQLSVDLERAPQVIRDLNDALNELRALRLEIRHVGTVRPRVGDDVSEDAATALSAAAVGGRGSLLAAVTAGADQLQAMVNGLQADLDAYQRGESVNVHTLPGTDRA